MNDKRLRITVGDMELVIKEDIGFSFPESKEEVVKLFQDVAVMVETDCTPYDRYSATLH